jgi:hypothetical protein
VLISSEKSGAKLIVNQKLQEAFMSGPIWWIRQIILISLGSFFLYYGIELLISSYGLNDPYTFIMTFFASNFIILISATLIFGFAYRMIAVYRRSKKDDSASE